MNYSIIAEPDTGIREGLMDALGSYNASKVGADRYQSYTIPVIDSAAG